MPIKSAKQKGTKFEKLVYDKLKPYFPEILRVYGSGATKESKGDLITNKYLFELKHHKSISDKEMNDWFNKLKEQAEEKLKLPVLVFRTHRSPIKVMMNHNFLDTNFRVVALLDDWLKGLK